MFCPECSEVLIPVWYDGVVWWYCPECDDWYRSEEDFINVKEVTMMAET